MNNSNFGLSMNDTAELRKLIVENPELPLLCFVGQDAWTDEYSYEQAEIHGCAVRELTMYNDYWLDRDDYTDALANDMEDMEEYGELSDKELRALVDENVENTEFVEAIVFYVG